MLLLKSFAKLNLYLEVLYKRKDNYHAIKTIFERISLADRITLNTCPGKKIKIFCDSPQVPTGRDNLAYRAALLLQEEFGIDKGVEIGINKIIPVAAGLGGGSSNAAAVLLGLNKLWGLRLAQEKLVCLAQKIGSDAAFFIYNCPFAEASGRGEIIRPINILKKKQFWHLLVVPRINISTPFIYQKWDKDREKAGLTNSEDNVKMLISGLRRRDFSLLAKALFNSLEKVTAQFYPKVTQARERLRGLGLKATLMSGSGPAVFAITSSRKEAVGLSRQLKKESRFWQVFRVKTV